MQLTLFEACIYLGKDGKRVLFQSKDKYRGPLKDSVTEVEALELTSFHFVKIDIWPLHLKRIKEAQI